MGHNTQLRKEYQIILWDVYAIEDDPYITYKLQHIENLQNIYVLFYMTAGLVIIISLQLLITSNYHVDLSIAAMTASYLFASISAAVLSCSFFSWYRIKHDIVVFLFSLTFTISSIGTGIIAVTNGGYLFLEKPRLTRG